MQIDRWENSVIVQSVTLPYSFINGSFGHNCTSLESLRELSGQDWREHIIPPKTLEELTQEINDNKLLLLSAICRAAKNKVEDSANAALQDQIWTNYKSTNPHPYSIAIINWGKSIYMEAEVRKSMVEANITNDLQWLTNFDSFGDKPYTVYQLYTAGIVEL